jgi:hypothetical protein
VLARRVKYTTVSCNQKSAETIIATNNNNSNSANENKNAHESTAPINTTSSV